MKWFFDWVLEYNLVFMSGIAVLFAAVGLLFRSGPSRLTDRDNFVYADGFQGLSVGALFVVAVMVYRIDDPRAVQVLKEQASIISTFSLLGCIQLADRYRRSLSQ